MIKQDENIEEMENNLSLLEIARNGRIYVLGMLSSFSEDSRLYFKDALEKGKLKAPNSTIKKRSANIPLYGGVQFAIGLNEKLLENRQEFFSAVKKRVNQCSVAEGVAGEIADEEKSKGASSFNAYKNGFNQELKARAENYKEKLLNSGRSVDLARRKRNLLRGQKIGNSIQRAFDRVGLASRREVEDIKRTVHQLGDVYRLESPESSRLDLLDRRRGSRRKVDISVDYDQRISTSRRQQAWAL